MKVKIFYTTVTIASMNQSQCSAEGQIVEDKSHSQKSKMASNDWQKFDMDVDMAFEKVSTGAVDMKVEAMATFIYAMGCE